MDLLCLRGADQFFFLKVRSLWSELAVLSVVVSSEVCKQNIRYHDIRQCPFVTVTLNDAVHSPSIPLHGFFPHYIYYFLKKNDITATLYSLQKIPKFVCIVVVVVEYCTRTTLVNHTRSLAQKQLKRTENLVEMQCKQTNVNESPKLSTSAVAAVRCLSFGRRKKNLSLEPSFSLALYSQMSRNTLS